MGNLSSSLELSKKEFRKHRKTLLNSETPTILLKPSNSVHFLNKTALVLFNIKTRKQKKKQYTIFDLSATFQTLKNIQTTKAVQNMTEVALKSGGTHTFQWDFLKTNGGRFSATVSMIFIRSGSQVFGQLKLPQINKIKQQLSLTAKPKSKHRKTKTMSGLKSTAKHLPKNLPKEEQDFLTNLLTIPKKKKMSSFQNMIGKSTAVSVSSAVYESQDENLEVSKDFHNLKITRLISKIENKVENSESSSLKNQIDEKLEQVFNIFSEAINSRDEQIKKLNEKLKVERKNHKKKFEKLESHLQRRLTGLQSEKETKKQMMEENLTFRRNLKEVEDFILKQNESFNRIVPFVNESVNFRNKTKNKEKTFLEALYKTSGSEDSDESVHNFDSQSNSNLDSDKGSESNNED
ncbi:hypothetical protein M0812_08328 [Anaeramoeba flamelloides]|uniref:Uncharacterized protein n=1 Tax=Anaeramoeba flamelloides TaxID=1746091 RepID=A0AAV7ZY69_9EUKA|nr:hypothetical protein M0812_08328 [Anaeramoeba flamelloides]